MPQPTLAQVVLLEVGAAAVLCGLAGGSGWNAVGIAVAALAVAAALLPVHRRWLYQVALAWIAWRRRRAAVRGPGLQSLLGGFAVQTVPGAARLGPFAVARTGTSWALPLAVSSSVTVPQLASLLQVEDVRLASVRLLSVLGPAGQVSRHCVLTLDTVVAAEAMAARGGSDAALWQVLRRCALRAEQVLAAGGVQVERLDERALRALFDSCLGTAALGAAAGPGRESWREVRVAGTWSAGYAAASDGAGPLEHLAAQARTPVAAICVVVRRSARRDAVRTAAYLRLTGTGAVPDHTLLDAVIDRARAAGLALRRADGDQVPALEATLPVPVRG